MQSDREQDAASLAPASVASPAAVLDEHSIPPGLPPKGTGAGSGSQTGSGAGSGAGCGAGAAAGNPRGEASPGVALTPGATLGSPHPAPSSIRPGSTPSRQNHMVGHSSSLDQEQGKGPFPDAAGPGLGPRDDLDSPYEPSSGLSRHILPSSAPSAASAPTAAAAAKAIATHTADGDAGSNPGPSKMIFTDFYRSHKSPLSRLRHQGHNHAFTLSTSEYDSDLVSKDKTKQKDAVRRHLAAKVRNDWEFHWPPEQPTAAIPVSCPLDSGDQTLVDQNIEGYLEVASVDSNVVGETVEGDETALDPGEHADSDSEVESVYSTVSEDPLHWRPRLEWASELSEDDILPPCNSSPFKFDSPDSIGEAVNASKIARKARRRRELRSEAAWNDGLACFEARRNAWTGAKVARVRSKPISPVSPTSPRKGLSFWRTHTNTSANTGHLAASPPVSSPVTLVTTSSQQSDAARRASASADNASDKSTPANNLSLRASSTESRLQQPETQAVETLLPIAPPLLPPANPMRASITPQLYNSIYEKVVLHSLQPSCPINLADMVRACVSGWKRDGEWPPRSAVPEPAAVVAVRRKKGSISKHANSAPAAQSSGRRKSLSFLTRNEGEKDKARRDSAAISEEGSGSSKAFRRSIQKVLGIGHSPPLQGVVDGHAMAH